MQSNIELWNRNLLLLYTWFQGSMKVLWKGITNDLTKRRIDLMYYWNFSSKKPEKLVVEYVRRLAFNLPIFPACGDADAEPGARMTCRLLLHLFRAPQACFFPQATGELTSEKALHLCWFGTQGSAVTKRAVQLIISSLVSVGLICRWWKTEIMPLKGLSAPFIM